MSVSNRDNTIVDNIKSTVTIRETMKGRWTK